MNYTKREHICLLDFLRIRTLETCISLTKDECYHMTQESLKTASQEQEALQSDSITNMEYQQQEFTTDSDNGDL